MPTTSPIIVALDFPEANAALEMAKALDPGKCRVKVGKELFTSAGPAGVESLQRLGFEVFLDLKFHDIPNTTASAVRAAAELGVWMVNVHASGGRRMMEACRDILERRGGQCELRHRPDEVRHHSGDEPAPSQDGVYMFVDRSEGSLPGREGDVGDRA